METRGIRDQIVLATKVRFRETLFHGALMYLLTYRVCITVHNQLQARGPKHQTEIVL